MSILYGDKIELQIKDIDSLQAYCLTNETGFQMFGDGTLMKKMFLHPRVGAKEEDFVTLTEVFYEEEKK